MRAILAYFQKNSGICVNRLGDATKEIDYSLTFEFMAKIVLSVMLKIW
jgi:hypothetical protein